MRKSSLALILGLFSFSPLTRAVEFEFTDTWLLDDRNRNTDWTYGSNWQSGNVPATDGSANVFFPSTLFYDFEYFSNPENFSIGLESDADVNSITFGNDVDYSFYSSLTSATLTVRDFISMSSSELESDVSFGFGLDVVLADGVTFDLSYGSELEIFGSLTNADSQTLTITGGGDGTLLLNNDNTGTLLGRIQVLDAVLGLAWNEAAGSAVIELGDAENPNSHFPGLMAVDGGRSIDNTVVINGSLRTYEDNGDENELTLAGEVRLTTDTLIENWGGLLSLDGDIIETTPGVKLSIDADEPVLFGGTSGFTGGLEMNSGAAIFTDISALPANPDSGGAFTSTSTSTYVGLLIDSESDRPSATTTFLSLFDPTAYTGILGFDTDPDSSTGNLINTYDSPIDLTGMSAASIGSVTTAELTGTITPAGPNYEFGGGGGYLLIGSLLEDELPLDFPATPTDGESSIALPVDVDGPVLNSRGLSVSSDQNEFLTVFINNAENSFTGDATARNSALIFGDVPGALPESITLRPEFGGYIGLQDATRSLAAYLGQFDPALETGVIGFDSSDGQTLRTISDPIDLSGFTSTNPDFYLGTSTWLEISGEITLPTESNEYRFTGYKGGRLEVISILADDIPVSEEPAIGAPTAVRIGDSDVRATYGHESPGTNSWSASSVRLVGPNTYSGGTYLDAGTLYVSDNASLGTGPLNVTANFERIGEFPFLFRTSFFEIDFNQIPQRLVPDVADLVLNNDIQLSNALGVEVAFNFDEFIDLNFELAGDISGNGGLLKTGDGTLTLSGNNPDFTGGLYINGGTVNINSDTGAGVAPIGFGGSYGSAQLNFNSPSPTVGGFYQPDFEEDEFDTALIPAPGAQISSPGMSSGLVNIAEDTQLTVDVSGFDLGFSGQISGLGSLEITGEGSQELNGFNDFAGGLTISGGANVRVGSSYALGSQDGGAPSVRLDGGSLQLDQDVEDEFSSTSANIEFGEGGGEIRGNGTLSFSETLAFEFGNSISPGNSIGALRFDGPVEFGELGFLDVEIGDGEEFGTLIADTLFVNELDITATPTNPFSISVRGENGNIPEGFDSNNPYIWMVVGSFTGITNLSLTNFDLQISTDLMTAGGEGMWGLATGSSGTAFGNDLVLTNNLLLVTFTPVPEPSTFALFAMGIALVALRFGRRRRA
ncbi:MAG: hypothetical protein SynsKO_36980 [Synoicihabitans sp.]